MTTYLFQSLYVICSNFIFMITFLYVTEFILYNSVSEADKLVFVPCPILYSFNKFVRCKYLSHFYI
jgi:hypothetical protein